VSLRPPLTFNPWPRRLSTPTDAFELHPDIALYGTEAVAAGVRKRERRYVFDNAYDGDASNEQVYAGTVLPLIAGVLRGTNATVFAYGATGSGKTHTMVGDQARSISHWFPYDRVGVVNAVP